MGRRRGWRSTAVNTNPAMIETNILARRAAIEVADLIDVELRRLIDAHGTDAIAPFFSTLRLAFGDNLRVVAEAPTSEPMTRDNERDDDGEPRMKLIARKHIEPEPQESVAELYLHELGSGVRVGRAPHYAVADITYDGERFVVELCNDTRVARGPSSVPMPFSQEVVKKLAAAVGKWIMNDGPKIDWVPRDLWEMKFAELLEKELSKLTTSVPAAPKSIPVKMTDKLPDRPGLWLRMTSDGGYQVLRIRDKKGTLVHEDSYAVSSYTGPWSEQPLEIRE